MKHIKLFEKFINERYVNANDVKGWEKDNGKLPFPAEVLAASKKMAEYGFAKDDELTKAHLWLVFNDDSYLTMKKYGQHVYQFYGSDFYSTFSGGYDHIFMKAKYYAAEVISHIEDKIANKEEVEPAYYEMKEYFNSFGMNYNKNRIFDAAVKHVEEWMKKNKI